MVTILVSRISSCLTEFRNLGEDLVSGCFQTRGVGASLVVARYSRMAVSR
jgi:hypothetical protein